MAAGIFISYRHDDTRHVAGRLAGDLAARFGADRIFRDIERIEPGVDFTEALNKALESCVLMLVIIGDRWLTITDAKGQRRLDDPQDWTRLEVVTALKRGIRVVPVLVEGAARPDITDLPEDLHPLVRRQTVQLADNRWKGDLQALVETLERMPGLERAAARPHESAASAPPPSPSPAPSPPPRPPFAPMPAAALAKAGRGQLLIGAGLGVVALLVAAASARAPAPGAAQA